MCEDAILMLGAYVQTSCCCLCAGLDSSNAARVVDILSGLASAGVTVIITIHQPRPDVFNLMQRVLILSGDGRLVYSGTAAFFHSFLGLCAEVFHHSFINACMQPPNQPSIHPPSQPAIHQPTDPSFSSFIHSVSFPRVRDR